MLDWLMAFAVCDPKLIRVYMPPDPLEKFSMCAWLRNASACLLPNALAFAVKGTSGMDARVVGGVRWASFRPSHRPGDARAVKRVGAGASVQRSISDADCEAGVGMAFELLVLSARERPRICSETDATRGRAGDRRRSRAEFR